MLARILTIALLAPAAFGACLAAASAPAAAQSAQPVVAQDKNAEPPLPLPLKEQRERGAQVMYLGKFDVLDGWMMIRTGQPEFYYSTPGNKAVVMGFLFDGQGQLQTGEQLRTLTAMQQPDVASLVTKNPQGAGIPAQISDAKQPAATAVPAQAQNATGAAAQTSPAQVSPAQAAAQVTAPTSSVQISPPAQPMKTRADMLFDEVRVGNSAFLGSPNAPVLYAFIDTNCPHCQQFLRDAELPLLQGEVAIRVLPIGFDNKSLRQGAYVLAAADGTTRLLAYAKGDKNALPEPEGIDIKGVNNNLKIMDNWGLDATPIIVYRSGGTGPVKLIRGRPKDLKAVLTDLAGTSASK